MVRGALSLGSTRLIANAIGAFSIIVLARLLTPDDFAVVAIASSVLSLVQSCTEMSLASALISRPQVSRSEIDTAWTMSLLRSGLIALIFAGFAWPVAQIYSNEGLFGVLLVSGLTGAAAGLQNPLIVQVTREMRFWPVAITQLLQKGLSLGFAIGLALALHSYWAIIAGNAIGAILSSLLTYWLVPYLPRLSLKHWRQIWSFSGWLFFKQIAETLNWRGDQLIVGAVVPATQFGQYAMADNLAVIPSRESVHPIRQALFPGLSNIGDDPARLRHAVVRAQATAAMIIAPVGVLLALLAEPVVHLALGPQWIASVPFVRIIAVLYTLGCFSIALQPVAMARNRTGVLFVQQVASLALKLPLLVLGLVMGGLLGAALARLLAEAVSTMFELFAIRVVTGIEIGVQCTSHATTAVGLAAMTAGLVLLDSALAGKDIGPLELFALEAVAGCALYVSAVVLAWTLGGRKQGPVTELITLGEKLTGGWQSATASQRPSADPAR